MSASIIWGINTLFLLDAGLDIFQVFIANAAYSLGNVLFEIPTGVVADTLGRRVSFLLSAIVLGATTLAYVAMAKIEAGVVAFSVVSVLIGLGYTFYTGAVEAWVVDALHATGYKQPLDRVFTRGALVSGAAMLIGTVGGGVLGQIDLAIPYVVRASMLGALFLVAFIFMKEIGYTPKSLTLRQVPREMRTLVTQSVKFGWNTPALRLLMIAAAFQWGFMGWGFYAWQPYLLELLGKDLIWVAGAMASLISVSMMVGNGIVEWITRRCAKRTTILLWTAGIQTAAAIGVGLADNVWVASACLLTVTGCMGVAGPVRQAYIHQKVKSEQRATVISFDSMVGNTGGVIGQAGLGYLNRVTSYSFTYLIGGAVTVFVIPLVALLRARREEADQIHAPKSTPPEGI